MTPRIANLLNRIGATLRSQRGRDVLLYLLCVLVAFIFWVFLALDTERQRDFDVPLELTDVPDSVTVIGNLPPSVSVSVKGKDSQLLKFLMGKLSPLKINFGVMASDGVVAVTQTRLDSRLRDYFGTPLQVVSFRPDSIRLPYTTLPGVMVKLIVQADIRPNPLYILPASPRAAVDSVTIYSVRPLPHTLHAVSTEPLILSGLKDTVRYEVKIKPIDGTRIVPDKVTVTVPVEPLINKKRTVRIDVTNLPDDKSLVTFPSKVEVSYLVPMSRFNDDYPIRASVNYKDNRLPGNKLPVSLSVIPSVYRNVSISLDSVEYIIENR